MDDRISDFELISGLCSKLQKEGIDRESLIGATETPLFEKFDALIPGELLRKAYASDRLRTDELEWRLPQILAEYRVPQGEPLLGTDPAAD